MPMEIQNTTTNKILKAWADAFQKTPSVFNAEMGYASDQGYKLLAGERRVTFETVGRLLVVYGAAGPAAQIAEVMRGAK